MPETDAPSLDRRALLGAIAAGASLAGCSSVLDRGADAAATELDDERAHELAVRFAPTLYFDEHERWFPTDPRPYEVDRDGEAVVDGFAAFDGYTDDYRRSGEPPAPTVFYHALRYEESPLAVVQFWFYSVFDQFTTNFHWHDWEVLHVFVDTDSGDPKLYVASSHSGNVPNNEYLDPDPETAPRVLSELGSHSSALSLNDAADQFQRLPVDDGLADITNSAIEGLEDVAEIPAAYGLPRDEGGRLPYVVPELDGSPIYEHERLPSVDAEALVAEELTVRSFEALASPPSELPDRRTGMVFRHGDETDGVSYDLVPTGAVEHLAEFTGPQLGFEFPIPQFAEDAVAHHITTAGVPWEQPRYENPAADISDPNHRAQLADRYDAVGEPAAVNGIVAGVTEAVASDDAPEGAGVTTRSSSVESVVLVQSDPVAVPTFRGVALVRDVPSGDHRFTVHGAGVTPHSETVSVAAEGGVTAAGVDGEVPLVAREHATKLEVDADGTDDDLTGLAVEDDFAGRLYDAPLSGRDAVYVHRGGAYTAEVRDAADEVGAFRVNPADESRVRIDEPRTGAGSLAEFLADVADETAASVAAGSDGSGGKTGSDGGAENATRGLVRALEAVAEAARRAAERAAAGDRSGTDERLAAVETRLGRAAARLSEARGDLSDELGRAVDRRLSQAERRAEQARAAEKL